MKRKHIVRLNVCQTVARSPSLLQAGRPELLTLGQTVTVTFWIAALTPLIWCKSCCVWGGKANRAGAKSLKSHPLSLLMFASRGNFHFLYFACTCFPLRSASGACCFNGTVIKCAVSRLCSFGLFACLLTHALQTLPYILFSPLCSLS